MLILNIILLLNFNTYLANGIWEQKPGENSYIGDILGNFQTSRLGSIVPVSLTSEQSENPHPENVHVTRTTVAEAKYYANVAGTAFCADDTLEAFKCDPYCIDVEFGTKSTPPTEKPIKVITIIRDLLVGVKGYLGVNDSRKEIIIGTAAERTQTNRVTLLLGVQLPLDVNRPGNNNTGIRTSAISVHALLYGAAHRMYKQYEQPLRKILDNPRYSDYTLVFAGHSIGGSIAFLSSVEVHHNLPIPWSRMRVFTYGAVPVGTIEFAKWYSQQDHELTRVTNHNDKVSKILRHYVNFHHPSNDVFITKDKDTVMCSNDYYEDPECDKIDFDFEIIIPHLSFWDTFFGIPC